MHWIGWGWKKWLLGLAALCLLASGWYYYTGVGSPQIRVNSKDSIASWDFKGPYTGNTLLLSQADADILKLTALLGTGEYDDYDLYVNIGNDYLLEGKGKQAFENYNQAAKLSQTKGQAYASIAKLMEQLGANYTAADAYGRAVEAEPGQLQYHLDRMVFLTQAFSTDTARVTRGFADAQKQFADVGALLGVEAAWLTREGNYTVARTVWQRARAVAPEKDISAIDAEVARLTKLILIK